MTIERVYEAIRDVLALPENVVLDRYSEITKLTEGGLEPAYLSVILQKLGVNSGDYCTGERLNDRGFNMLVGIILSEGQLNDIAELGRRFRKSMPHNPVISSTDLAEYMKPVYLEKILEYDSALKKELKLKVA